MMCNRGQFNFMAYRAVAAIQLAHNTAVNGMTGYSPHQLLYNQEPSRPESLLVKRWAASGQLADEMWGTHEKIRQMARNQVQKSLQLVNAIYRKVKKCIEYHQEKWK